MQYGNEEARPLGVAPSGLWGTSWLLGHMVNPGWRRGAVDSFAPAGAKLTRVLSHTLTNVFQVVFATKNRGTDVNGGLEQALTDLTRKLKTNSSRRVRAALLTVREYELASLLERNEIEFDKKYLWEHP